MSIWRYLNGKISAHYGNHFSWKNFHMTKYWSGRLIYFHVGKFYFVLDCRKDVAKDLMTGKPE